MLTDNFFVNRKKEVIKTETFNNIGIDGKLDWQRIRKLMIIGLLAGIMVFVGDMILGYGVYDDSLTVLERTLAQKAAKTDSQLFWAAFLGLIGIPLEGLTYFSIYRLMAERSPKHAHSEPVHIESKSTQQRVDMRNNTHSFSVNSFYLIVF